MEVDDHGDSRGIKRKASEDELASQPPRRIKALDPDVVNKIAAGEIIVAPMHALKEMIENSVDAGSTSIEILVKDGGLKLLQITDNGHGIDHDDLSILCERFTTSKLKAFEDLTSIATYGFRGEALASISHIAHLMVTTKTASSSCAWRAHYSDGKLVPAKPGQSAKPKPTAGRGGTQITVEDLFYNIPTRRRAFRSSSEEYAKVLDIVGRYAIHCSGIAFSCKKHGDSGVSISTSANSSTTDRIRQIHGSAVANELIGFNILDNRKWGFSASGLVTNANYHVKRTTILLFINHRAVESSSIKKAIEQLYSNFLPKGGHPWAYIDLEIEPQRVDVNVHPTKREVNFLNEDEIIETICDEIRSKLAQVDSSRTFMTQTLLPGVKVSNLQDGDVSNVSTGTPPQAGNGAGGISVTTPVQQKVYEHNLIRTDARLRKITSMFAPTSTPSRADRNGDGENRVVGDETPASATSDDGLHYEKSNREPIRIALTSVKSLRAVVRASMHAGLTEAFATHTFVGVVDERRRIAAIQSGIKLYLIDYGLICEEFFYQLGLTDFGNFGVIQLDPPPKLEDLLKMAADAEREEHITKKKQHIDSNSDPQRQASILTSDEESIFQQAPLKVAKTLIDRRDMLDEYFSLRISETGELLTIPLLLKGYVPSLGKLPRFLLRLGPYVDWADEEECFRTFLRELAGFYTPEQLPPPTPKDDTNNTITMNKQNEMAIKATAAAEATTTTIATTVRAATAGEEETQLLHNRRMQLTRMLEHAVFPALRSRLVAVTELLTGVVEVADLKGLYRVFERC